MLSCLVVRNPHSWHSAAIAFIAWILTALLAPAATGPDFSIVVLPDMQFYSETYPKIAVAQTDWIVANRQRLNIVYVAQLGDITQNGDEKPEEWANAANALYRLESPQATGLPCGIPYGVVPGNHDHRGGTSLFERTFGVAHFAGRPYYGGHYGNGNSSHFDLFTAGGIDFIVVYIDYDPANPSHAPIDTWADIVLKSNPRRRAIVVSHDLLAVNGSFDPRGQTIYDKLKYNPNLFLMLCGHNHGEARRNDTYDGRTVVTCLSDYQSWPEGGGGYLRLYRFSPAENLVRVQTFSPWTGKFKTDNASQFEFPYRMQAPLYPCLTRFDRWQASLPKYD
ncbi:MAG: metallophosphoesterase [Verrucomicrobiota bacterium]